MFSLCVIQGGAMRNSYNDVGQRFGLDPDLSDADIQMRLEELKEVHFLFL